MMERIQDDRVGSFEDDAARAAGGQRAGSALPRLLLLGALVGAAVLGWQWLGPKSALARAGWSDNWERAVEQSRKSGKPALALFTADWCPGCRQFESQVLRDEEVQEYLRENFTLVMVDLSNRSGPNNDRAREFGIRTIPTLILYDRQGEEAARANGMPAEMLMIWLQSGGRPVRAGAR